MREMIIEMSPWHRRRDSLLGRVVAFFRDPAPLLDESHATTRYAVPLIQRVRTMAELVAENEALRRECARKDARIAELDESARLLGEAVKKYAPQGKAS